MGQHTLRYGDQKITYQVSTRQEIDGKVSIHVHADGVVTVDAPADAPPEKIRAAMRRRARWITDHLSRIQSRRYGVLPRQYVSGESHLYLGRRYQLKVLQDSGAKSEVKMIRGQLRATVAARDPMTVKKLLRSWYRDHARDVFQKRLELIAAQAPWVKRELPAIKLVSMKKQWGSCSPSGVILLNPHLVKAPRECVDYVIAHELCHLKEKNHSPKFWKLLNELCPDQKMIKHRLDEMADALLNE